MRSPEEAAPVLSDCDGAHPRTQGNGDGGAGAWGQLGHPPKACATQGVCGQPLCTQRSVCAHVNGQVCALCIPARLCSVCAWVPTNGPKWRESPPMPQFPQQHREGMDALSPGDHQHQPHGPPCPPHALWPAMGHMRVPALWCSLSWHRAVAHRAQAVVLQAGG